MLQGLCPTLQIVIFSCALELPSQHIGFITHVLQSLSLSTNIKMLMCSRSSRSMQTLNTHVFHSFSLNTKHQILMCSRASRSTQNIKYSYSLQVALTANISSIMCFSVHAQHMKSYHKTYEIGIHPIYQTNHHSHV